MFYGNRDDTGVACKPGGGRRCLHKAVPACLRLPEGDCGPVRRKLPHSAAAAGPAYPEDKNERIYRVRPLHSNGKASGRRRQAGLRHRQASDKRVQKDLQGGAIDGKLQHDDVLIFHSAAHWAVCVGDIPFPHGQ